MTARNKRSHSSLVAREYHDVGVSDDEEDPFASNARPARPPPRSSRSSSSVAVIPDRQAQPHSSTFMSFSGIALPELQPSRLSDSQLQRLLDERIAQTIAQFWSEHSREQEREQWIREEKFVRQCFSQIVLRDSSVPIDVSFGGDVPTQYDAFRVKFTADPFIEDDLDEPKQQFGKVLTPHFPSANTVVKWRLPSDQRVRQVKIDRTTRLHCGAPSVYSDWAFTTQYYRGGSIIDSSNPSVPAMDIGNGQPVFYYDSKCCFYNLLSEASIETLRDREWSRYRMTYRVAIQNNAGTRNVEHHSVTLTFDLCRLVVIDALHRLLSLPPSSSSSTSSSSTLSSASSSAWKQQHSACLPLDLIKIIAYYVS